MWYSIKIIMTFFKGMKFNAIQLRIFTNYKFSFGIQKYTNFKRLLYEIDFAKPFS
jgi:hypothetical protein